MNPQRPGELSAAKMSEEYAEAIMKALDEVEAPGEFACCGRASKGVLPELEVQVCVPARHL